MRRDQETLEVRQSLTYNCFRRFSRGARRACRPGGDWLGGIVPRAWLLVICGVGLGGCGPTDHSGYIPSESRARRGLETVLNAWQAGQAEPAAVPFEKSKIEVQDEVWQAGKKLVKFEILKEIPATNDKRFLVQLTLADEPQPREVEYVVVGKDLWVLSEPDYRRMTGQ